MTTQRNLNNFIPTPENADETAEERYERILSTPTGRAVRDSRLAERAYLIKKGLIVPLESRPTLRLRPGEREKFEAEAEILRHQPIREFVSSPVPHSNRKTQ